MRDNASITSGIDNIVRIRMNEVHKFSWTVVSLNGMEEKGTSVGYLVRR